MGGEWRKFFLGSSMSLALGCHPASSAEHPPACFGSEPPRVTPGAALLRVRWLHHTDEAFRARAVQLTVDEREIYTSDERGLEREHAVLRDVELTPGRHRLHSSVQVWPHGKGLFAHLEQYRSERRQQLELQLDAGTATCVSIVLSYRGGLTAAPQERPQLSLVQEPAGSGSKAPG